MLRLAGMAELMLLAVSAAADAHDFAEQAGGNRNLAERHAAMRKADLQVNFAAWSSHARLNFRCRRCLRFKPGKNPEKVRFCGVGSSIRGPAEPHGAPRVPYGAYISLYILSIKWQKWQKLSKYHLHGSYGVLWGVYKLIRSSKRSEPSDT